MTEEQDKKIRTLKILVRDLTGKFAKLEAKVEIINEKQSHLLNKLNK